MFQTIKNDMTFTDSAFAQGDWENLSSKNPVGKMDAGKPESNRESISSAISPTMYSMSVVPFS